MGSFYGLKIMDNRVQTHMRWSQEFRGKNVPVVACHFPHENEVGERHDQDCVEIQFCAGGKSHL
jgi:hypothetical protein